MIYGWPRLTMTPNPMTTCKRCNRLTSQKAHYTSLYINESCAVAVRQSLRELGFYVVPQLGGSQDRLPR